MTEDSTSLALKYLSFHDWMGQIPEVTPGWIVVAQSWKNGYDDLYTMSALAQGMETSLLLENYEWDVRPGFGMPYFEVEGKEESEVAVFNSGDSHLIDGIEIRPFSISQSFFGYVPGRFEIVQSFILFHNAFLEPNSNVWKRVTYEGDIVAVMRESVDGENRRIEIDTHLLRDYLAAVNCSLVRYHDHRRFVNVGVDAFGLEELKPQSLSTASYRFDMYFGDISELAHNGIRTFSRLLGKDIIKPYSQPDESHFWWRQTSMKQFAKFIIGRDDSGKLVESNCNESVLSNNFTDRGTPHFLTPVFFQRQVLEKYYSEPSRFEVGDDDVSCLGIWSMPIDTTDEGLVHVWLGDLGRIPYKEQLHWRNFNVEPKGTITEHRFKRDFEAMFVEPENLPVRTFKRQLTKVRSASKNKFGASLFLELSSGDKHYETSLRIPLNEEWNEFDSQIQALAKLMVDSLNLALLRKLLGEQASPEDKSITLLEKALANSVLPEGEQKSAIRWLRATQELRSTASAHRKGTNFENAIKKMGMESVSNQQRVKTLIEGLTRSLYMIEAWVEDAEPRTQ